MDRKENGGKMPLPQMPKNVIKSSHSDEAVPSAPSKKNVVSLGSQKNVMKGDLERDQ